MRPAPALLLALVVVAALLGAAAAQVQVPGGAAVAGCAIALFLAADRLPRASAAAVLGGVLATLAVASEAGALADFGPQSSEGGVGDVVWLGALFLVPAWVAGMAAGSRRHRIAELRALNHALAAERERAARLAAEAERARLAHDIEVVLARSVLAILADLERVRGDLDDAGPALRAIRGRGGDALSELRRLLDLLHSPAT